AIMREARRGRCDVVVLSPNPYLIGYVNFARVRRYTPIVCDYVDGGAWTGQDVNYERCYVESSDAVICVSRLLTQQARAVNDFCFFIPRSRCVCDLDHRYDLQFATLFCRCRACSCAKRPQSGPAARRPQSAIARDLATSARG